MKTAEPEAAILGLRVLDPAVGSGHFLVAAARRIARRLASVRTGDPEPAPEAVRHALRDVVGRCLYGIDVNPMAVELCKVSLWMEGTEPGRALSFLDSHIVCGNALLGAYPSTSARRNPGRCIHGSIRRRQEVRRELAGAAIALNGGTGNLAAGSRPARPRPQRSRKRAHGGGGAARRQCRGPSR